jgi:hypothetical protein
MVWAMNPALALPGEMTPKEIWTDHGAVPFPAAVWYTPIMS